MIRDTPYAQKRFKYLCAEPTNAIYMQQNKTSDFAGDVLSIITIAFLGDVTKVLYSLVVPSSFCVTLKINRRVQNMK